MVCTAALEGLLQVLTTVPSFQAAATLPDDFRTVLQAFFKRGLAHTKPLDASELSCKLDVACASGFFSGTRHGN